ncbi:MAG TPA: ISL3 family transposase, partial [Acidimicrobiales bacterium]|nr:ISL3 family transposase [Acidimicrobiales bacterium]
MAQDGMTIRLHLKRIKVVRVVEDEIDKLVIEVADTRTVVRCPACGHKTTKIHETRKVEVRDLPMGRPTTLIWLQRRFECPNCGERHTEDHPEIEGKLTRRLARQLVRDAKYLTIRELSRRHRLSWHLIMGLVRTWATALARHRRSLPCRVLLVDETSLRRRHRYVTVLLNGESGEVLAMVKHRDAAALSGFFASQGHRWCRRVKVVVSDGSESYRAAIGRHVGHATHVVDRFHVVRWFAAGLVEVRRRIQRREPRGHVSPAFDPEVFRSRFLALRRADRLGEAEVARLEALFAAHAELARAWGMLQELHGLYVAESEEEATAALDRFARLYQHEPLPEFYKVVDTLLKWAPEIFA